MKSITVLLFCVLVSSALARKRLQRTADQIPLPPLLKFNVDDLIDHYNQIDLAPFVETTKAKREAERAIVTTSVVLIREENFDEAKKLLDGVDIIDIIGIIVKRAYDSNFKNTVKIIEFIKTLEELSDQMKGFSTLYDEMKKKQDMINPAIIEIAYWMQHHVQDADVILETEEFPERFLFYDIEEYSIVTEALECLANKLKDGDTEDLEFLAEKYPGAFTAVVPKLINAVYNRDEKNFNLVMTLADNKSLSPTLKETILDELLESMHELHHLVGENLEVLKNKIFINTSNVMSSLKKKFLNLTRSY